MTQKQRFIPWHKATLSADGDQFFWRLSNGTSAGQTFALMAHDFQPGDVLQLCRPLPPLPHEHITENVGRVFRNRKYRGLWQCVEDEGLKGAGFKLIEGTSDMTDQPIGHDQWQFNWEDMQEVTSHAWGT